MSFMEFVKKEDRAAVRRTGTNDEPVPHEIMQGLEDFHEDWLSHCAAGESRTISAVAQKKKDQELAEALRQSALIGNISAIQAAAGTNTSSASSAQHAPDKEDEDWLTSTPATRRSSSASGPPSSGRSSGRSKSPTPSGPHGDLLLHLAARSEERNEERVKSKRDRLEREDRQEERDSKRLQLKEHCIQLECDRLELDRMERIASREERKASAALMQALALSLLGKNNNDTNRNDTISE
jgi:hypothetical protein